MVLLLSEWQWWRQVRGLRCCYCWGLELELGHCEGEEKISLKSTKGFWPKLLWVQQPAILSQLGHLHHGSGQICAPLSLRWALATAFTFAIRTRLESDVLVTAPYASPVCSAMLPDHSSTFQTDDDVQQNASRTAQLYFGAKWSVLLSWDS